MSSPNAKVTGAGRLEAFGDGVLDAPESLFFGSWRVHFVLCMETFELMVPSKEKGFISPRLLAQFA